MAKNEASEQTVEAPAKAHVGVPSGRTKTLKQCECGATKFQGPYTRGEIVNDVFIEQERIYQCIGCHKVQPVDKLHDHVVELP